VKENVLKERPSWTVPLEVRKQQLEDYLKYKEEILRDLKPLQKRRYRDLSATELLLLSALEDDLEDMINNIKNARKRIKEWETGSTYLTRSLKQSTGQSSHIAQQGV
jgi:hypothetical protein